MAIRHLADRVEQHANASFGTVNLFDSFSMEIWMMNGFNISRREEKLDPLR